MIEVQRSNLPGEQAVIEVRSNLSMTLDRLAAVFLALSAVVLLVALRPTIMGYWPIMAAAIIHLVLVGWCLRLAWRGNWARERISVGPEEVVIEHFDAYRQTRSRWPSAWLRVEVEQKRMGDRQVAVTSRGHRQVIGAFLPLAERLQLAEALKDCLRPYSGWGEDKQSQVRQG